VIHGVPAPKAKWKFMRAGGCMVRAVSSYRDLDVWRLGVDLVLDCYALTNSFPPRERFGLTSQARRAAVSIPSNVAEGHNRRSPHSRNAYRNHVSIALGSSGELDTHLELARRLGYGRPDELAAAQQKLNRVGQMLRRLQQRLENDAESSR
jgi:four helix bundle protein